jgi:hypothetical protein
MQDTIISNITPKELNMDNPVQTECSAGYDSQEQEPASFLNTTLSQPFEDRPHVLQKWDWFFGISLVFLLLLAFIKLVFYKSFILSYRELIKGMSASRTYNNDSSQTRFPFLLLIVGTCFVCSLAIYVIFCQLFEQENMLFFLQIFAMVMCFLFVRFFILKIVGFLFNIKSILSQWSDVTDMLYFISSVLCFPFIFIAYYYSSSFFLVLSLIIFSLIFLYGFTLGWTICKKKIRIYEYFLYLCTIEILPLLLFLKFVTSRLLIF